MPMPDFKPGDLIDANQLKTYFTEIEKRLSDLEKKDEIRQGQVFITRLLPAGGVRIGEELIISGGNFYVVSGAAWVSLNNVPRLIKSGSTDTEIRIDIPVGTPLGTATVEVGNSFTEASQTTEILPAVIPLEGDVVVRFKEVTPQRILTTNTQPIRYTFTYEIDAADTTHEATYTVTARLVEKISPWQQSIHIVDPRTGAQRSPNFRLSPFHSENQKATFGVQIDLSDTPQHTNSFTLRVDVAAEDRAWSLGSRTFKNNENVVPPNPFIQIGAPNVEGTFDGVTNTITGIANLSLPVVFTGIGSYFLVGHEPAVAGVTFTVATPRNVEIERDDLDAANGNFTTTILVTYRPTATSTPATIDIGYRSATGQTVTQFTFRPS